MSLFIEDILNMQSECAHLVDLDQPLSSNAPSFMTHFDSNKDACAETSAVRMRVDDAICGGCGFEIRERFLLKVMDEFWHENCLSCSTCHLRLSDNSTCFIKDGHVYCREDHAQLFSARCARCGITLQPTDFVFRCLNSTYHAQCFSCVYCNHPLKKGDQYLVLDGQVICRADYELLLCNQPMPHAYFDVEQSESNRKTPKRPRTILNTQQRRAFKLAFEKSAKPCRKVREQLAKETGLSVRVVQVWFQNQRAKMKKILRKQEVTKMNGTTSSEGDAKSIDDSKSNCDSDDGNLFSCDLDSDGEELEVDNSSDEKLKELSNPIDKLYNMQATYFAFT